MTLKEKIENILCNWIDKDCNREFVAKQIEIDADDYAIEFGEWLLSRATGEEGLKLRDDILEIFKKEKGL